MATVRSSFDPAERLWKLFPTLFRADESDSSEPFGFSLGRVTMECLRYFFLKVF